MQSVLKDDRTKEKIAVIDREIRHRLQELCELIAKENNSGFSKLVAQLNQLLDGPGSFPDAEPDGTNPTATE